MREKREQKVSLFSLFIHFCRFGLFTFGGGWSIIAQMQRTFVEKEKVISQEDLLDLSSVGRSLPGTMIGNVAVLFGYETGGIPGALLCLFGLITPPLLVLTAITMGYQAFRDNPWVNAGMMGIRAAIVPIIFSAVLGLIKGAYRYKACVLFTLVAFFLYTYAGMSAAALVVTGGVFGLLLSEVMERREAKRG
ncbi:MAG: chromate transporter [Blautia sp.]|nr:chromate transporter [Blautia sp.]